MLLLLGGPVLLLLGAPVLLFGSKHLLLFFLGGAPVLLLLGAAVLLLLGAPVLLFLGAPVLLLLGAPVLLLLGAPVLPSGSKYPPPSEPENSKREAEFLRKPSEGCGLYLFFIQTYTGTIRRSRAIHLEPNKARARQREPASATRSGKGQGCQERRHLAFNFWGDRAEHGK